MKFNKDSKIIRVSAYAEGYYSGATAYGELYIPHEFYEKHKETLSELSLYVGELDGKHSEVRCDIEFEEITITDILRMENTPYEQDHDIDEDVFYRFCRVLSLSDEEGLVVNNFSNEILSLEKMPIIEKIHFDLALNTLIDGHIVPKGTAIEFDKVLDNKISDNWSWEFDWKL